MTADVRVEDPEFAKSLCKKFHAGEFQTMECSPGLEVFPLAMPVAHSLDGFARRVNCKKVICSWHKPMRVAVLKFDSEQLARDVCGRFHSGAYKVLGSKVSCGLRQTDPTYNARGRHLPWLCGDWRPWRLTLRVSLEAASSDILRTIPKAIRPRSVEFVGTTYGLVEDCKTRHLAMIEKLLTKIGPLEMALTPSMEAPGKRVKAMARFKYEADAKEASKTLDGTRLPFNESDKLNVNLVYSATYKVVAKVFEAVQADIDAAKIAYKEQHINFKSFPPTNGYVTLRLEGECYEDLVSAEEVVDGILRGLTVMDKATSKPFWNPSLGNRSAAGKILWRIEQELQVAFQCVASKAEVPVYGAPDKTDKACEALRRAFSDSQSTSHSIFLDERNFQWATRGGFQSLRDTLGPENVTLNILPTQKRIDVIGPRSSYDLAMDIMSGKKVSQRNTTSTGNCCSVCWTEAENPLTTACGHIYCLDCFENFYQSAESGDNGYHLSCLAEQGSCGVVFSLPELQEHLSSLTFEELLASSVKSYVDRHPGEFRYCPTADCGRVYRVTSPDQPKFYSCAGCLKTTCTSCHQPHEGKSCAEHRYILSGGDKEFEKAKAKYGIKDCPKCSTSIQKSEGCNHMTCGKCGAHICWVCLATFPTKEPSYAHLNRKHGSIFSGDPLYDA